MSKKEQSLKVQSQKNAIRTFFDGTQTDHAELQ